MDLYFGGDAPVKNKKLVPPNCHEGSGGTSYRKKLKLQDPARPGHAAN